MSEVERAEEALPAPSITANERSAGNVPATVVYKYPLKTNPHEEEAGIGIQLPTSNGIFPRNLIHDPEHTLDGMLELRSFLGNAFQTP
jgi:hypothetical protein